MRERVRTKSFLFGTIFLAILPAAAIVIPTLVADDGPRSDDVALVGQAPAELEAALTAAGNTGGASEAEIKTRTLPDEAAARTALQDEEIDAAVIEGRRLLVRQDPAEKLVGLLRQVLTTVRSQVGPMTTVMRLRTDVVAFQPITVEMVEETRLPDRWAPKTATRSRQQVVGLVPSTDLTQGFILQTVPLGDHRVTSPHHPCVGRPMCHRETRYGRRRELTRVRRPIQRAQSSGSPRGFRRQGRGSPTGRRERRRGRRPGSRAR